eukprot:CAMPEP_0170532486 /NCGR_PEP_ID=MMETSP0209-20121228/72466_1 /TAXON_ID=665100 ORGANISM="Litonotus pictus, Strain P1" /NCGR_SAMPLE_ID=MMETSP0209 /ASSEMBLY_ACC=CAM_ASM_000301 /LENGTH=209 /DNA_ID=CAMNT_0010828667 /DNA_START=332 /DNA_END=957 /DNA_ORIENTATION=-
MTGLNPNNSYGKSKLTVEGLLEEVSKSINHNRKINERSRPENVEMNQNQNQQGIFKAISLRYFNPVGCHESGLIGDCSYQDQNLFKIIERVSTGDLQDITIFGKDYNTRDKTPIRDFIHVCDISEGHVMALNYLIKSTEMDMSKSNMENQGVASTYEVFNMGTEKGYTVLEVINSYMKANNIKIPFKFGERREGDLEELVSDSTKILNT